MCVPYLSWSLLNDLPVVDSWPNAPTHTENHALADRRTFRFLIRSAFKAERSSIAKSRVPRNIRTECADIAYCAAGSTLNQPLCFFGRNADNCRVGRLKILLVHKPQVMMGVCTAGSVLKRNRFDNPKWGPNNFLLFCCATKRWLTCRMSPEPHLDFALN